MRLRTKTLLIVGVTVFGLLGILYTASSAILLGSFSRLEEQSTRQNVNRANQTIREEIISLGFSIQDWSNWGETYEFVKDRNSTFIQDNLHDQAFVHLQLDLMVFLDPQGKIVYAKSYDRQRNKEVPIPESLRSHLASNRVLWQHFNPKSTYKGLIILPENPLIVASAPILTDHGEGPIRGTLIWGRYLNDADLQQVAQSTQLSLKVYTTNNPKLPSDFDKVRSSLVATSQNDYELSVFNTKSKQPTPPNISRTQLLPNQRIGGYTLLRDIYGKPALLLRVDTARDIYQQGRKSLNYLLISLLVTGVVFGGSTLLLLEKMVISRLEGLSRGVSEIGGSSDPSKRLASTGNDELASLTTTINGMLQALEQSESKRRESQERYRILIEQASDGILIVDADTKRILEANSALRRYLGYSEEAIQMLTLYEIVAHNPADIDRNLEQVSIDKKQFLGERRYRCANGLLIDVEVSINTLSYGGSPVYCFVVRDISYRKRVETALRESEERLRATIEQAAVGIAHGGLDGTTLLVNQKLCDILGYDREELMTKTYLELTHPDDLALDEEYSHQLIAGEISTFSIEKRYIRKDRSVIWVNLTASLVRDQTGTPKYNIAVVEDISYRKEVEAALRENEERLRGIFEQAAVGIAQSSLDGKYLFVNQKYADILGYTLGELLTKNYLDLTYPDDRAIGAAYLQQLIAGDISTYSYEKRYIRKDGSLVWVNITVSLLRDDAGVPKYDIAVIKDISDRKQVEAALKESEALLRAILEQAPVGIAQSSMAGQNLLVNQKYADILGYTREELLTKTYMELTYPEDLAADAENMSRLIADGTSTFSMEKRYLHKKGGIIWTNLTVSVVRDTLGRAIYDIGVIEDITERKRVEAELKESEERFKAIAQAIPIPLLISRVPDGKVLYVNQPLGTILGMSAEAILATETTNFYYDESDRQRLTNQLRQDGYLRNYDVQLKKADGTPFWVLISSEFITFNSESAVVTVLYDITERKLFEAALADAEARYRSIFENATEGIFQSTPDGQYLNVNPALARIYGYDSIEDLVSQVRDIQGQLYVDPKRRSEFVAAMEEYGTVADFESQVYRKDQTIIWISENARSVRDERGHLLYYEGTVEDITSRKVAQEALRYQQEQSERLLLNILPAPIAQRLKIEQSTIADSFDDVTVLFADLVGFTQLSSNIPPTELVDLLNQIFSAFDQLAEQHGLEKIKTIGDAYMVVGGLPEAKPDHAEAIAAMSLDMISTITQFQTQFGSTFNLRIGINTGPVIAGVIGIKKFIYDLWGDTVNIASRMESHGIPGSIQVSQSTYDLLKDCYQFQERGSIPIKGKGEMTTYLLRGYK